jgi:hypothetical protein
VVVAGSAGYGFLDSTSVVEGGHQGRGSAAVVYSPLPELSLGLDLSGHVDRYPDLAVGGEKVKLYGEPRLAARFVQAATPQLSWGAQLDARFVGAEAPSIEPGATSPSLVGLVSFELEPTTWLAAQLGFHLDRSAQAIPDPAVVQSADKRTLGASSWNAIRWGVGASHRLARGTELLGELSGDALIGAGKPKFSRSPARLSLGARQPLGHALTVLVNADVSLNKRPLTMLGPDLIPIEPRAAIAMTLIWRPGAAKPVATPPPEATPEPAPRIVKPEPVAPPEPVSVPMHGTVVDEGGRPMPDVEVKLSIDGQPETVTHTSAEGVFDFPDAIAGPAHLVVTTPGYDEVTVEFGDQDERTREIVLHESVPAGQLRGRVLDLQGKPLGATIRVEPGGQQVRAQADGSFDLDLSPGRYTVTFRNEGFSPQKRTITVKNRGVVILNIALTR